MQSILSLCIFFLLASHTRCLQSEVKPMTIGFIVTAVFFGVICLIIVIIAIRRCCYAQPQPTQTIFYPPANSQFPQSNWNIHAGIFAQHRMNIANALANNQHLFSLQFPSNYTLQTYNQQLLQEINQQMPRVSNDTCTICLNDKTNARLLPCEHEFHADCMREWSERKKICPNCNSESWSLILKCRECGKYDFVRGFCKGECGKFEHFACFMEKRVGDVCRKCEMGRNEREYLSE